MKEKFGKIYLTFQNVDLINYKDIYDIINLQIIILKNGH